jgi:hypothetical protein
VVPGAVSMKDYSGRCWAFNDGNMRTFAAECYDSLSFCADSTCLFGREDRSTFGTFVNASKYYWEQVCFGVNLVCMSVYTYARFMSVCMHIIVVCRSAKMGHACLERLHRSCFGIFVCTPKHCWEQVCFGAMSCVLA